MKLSYSGFTNRANTYLRGKRSQSRLWHFLLPERIFEPSLWLWQARSVSVAAAWGVFWALAPVPMQSIFAILCAMWFRANIPIALGICWLSFPGYQLIVWPAQWWLGHALLTPLNPESTLSLRSAKVTIQSILNRPLSITFENIDTQFLTIAAELLLGCLVSCTAAALLVYAATRISFRIFRSPNAE